MNGEAERTGVKILYSLSYCPANEFVGTIIHTCSSLRQGMKRVMLQPDMQPDMLTSSITRILDLFKMARAMQSSCFSLLKNIREHIQRMDNFLNHAPYRKIVAPIRNRGIQITEDILVEVL